MHQEKEGALKTEPAPTTPTKGHDRTEPSPTLPDGERVGQVAAFRVQEPCGSGWSFCGKQILDVHTSNELYHLAIIRRRSISFSFNQSNKNSVIQSPQYTLHRRGAQERATIPSQHCGTDFFRPCRKKNNREIRIKIPGTGVPWQGHVEKGRGGWVL